VTFDAQLKTKLQSLHHAPSAEEARAIVDVARLAAAADKRTDLGETVVLLSVTRIVCEMAGLSGVPATTPIDVKRLADIGELLSGMRARELAFACAFLVMISDLELTKEESALADGLGEALVLDAARTKQLAGEMEALVRAARAS
jgi:hypothetical protein